MCPILDVGYRGVGQLEEQVQSAERTAAEEGWAQNPGRAFVALLLSRRGQPLKLRPSQWLSWRVVSGASVFFPQQSLMTASLGLLAGSRQESGRYCCAG